MKKFTINLFSNHFGIALAALNICYLAAKSSDLFSVSQTLLGRIFICLNIPAMIFTQLIFKTIDVFFIQVSYPAQINLKFALLTFFIILQWFFIAFIAKTIARKF